MKNHYFIGSHQKASARIEDCAAVALFLFYCHPVSLDKSGVHFENFTTVPSVGDGEFVKIAPAEGTKSELTNWFTSLSGIRYIALYHAIESFDSHFPSIEWHPAKLGHEAVLKGFQKSVSSLQTDPSWICKDATRGEESYHHFLCF